MIHSLVSNQHFLFWDIFIFILKINFSALLYKEAMALVKSPMVPPFSRVQVVQSILLGYLNTTGWIRWSPGRNAPFLKGRRLAPTLVVPSGKMTNLPQSLFTVLLEMVFKASCLDTLLLLLTKTICRNLRMVPSKGVFLFSSLTMAEHRSPDPNQQTT